MRSFIDSPWRVAAELAGRDKAGSKEGSHKRAKTLGRRGVVVAETSRVALSLRWLRAFLRRWVQAGELGRAIDIREWSSGQALVVACDASPWEIGAVLEVDGPLAASLHDGLGDGGRQALGGSDRIL